MRLRHALAIAITAAALALGGAPAHAEGTATDGAATDGTLRDGTLRDGTARDGGTIADSAAVAERSFEAALPEREPTCGDPAARAFPLRTGIHGGPPLYRPGGGFQSWNVELTNTTAQPCRNIHPVIVLTDRDQDLAPPQVQLEFRAEGAGHRPVAVETTEEKELVGVLDDGFPGFTVPARATVTVPVRLAFTSDTRPDDVIVKAAVVQRRGDDGDWVGESAGYRFTVAPEAPFTPPPGVAQLPEEIARTGRDALLVAGAATAALLLGAGALTAAGRLRDRRR
ncbi:hypothetical protein [Streptomyces sp. NPDC050856]|uniref:hypothetical protein n=1 Tax=Streptomyces sp. NPDC050856 TaxID=3154939 RepID=UPI0033C7DA9C